MMREMAGEMDKEEPGRNGYKIPDTKSIRKQWYRETLLPKSSLLHLAVSKSLVTFTGGSRFV